MSHDYFILNEGVLEIQEDKLHIEDNARQGYNLEIFTGVCGFIYGSSSALRGYKEHDLPWLIFGLFLTITWCILLPHRIFKNNVDSEIPFQRISKIELKKSWFGTSRTGRIITSDNKSRLIRIEEDEIIAKNLVEKLQAKNIQVIT